MATPAYIPWEHAVPTETGNLPSGQEHRQNPMRRRFDNVLRTMAVLQTTLDLEELLRLFAREVGTCVPHSGVRYCNSERDIDVTVGRKARYHRTYRLRIEHTDLGRLTFDRGKVFTPDEAAQLRFLLGSLLYPLRNALQYKRAFDASLTDPLTGVYNRAGMELALRREISLARRQKTPLSLIVFDLDGFKTVNDRYGHKAGDRLIKLIASHVSRCLRASDIFARYGGDEFTILLSNTGRKGAVVLAQHVRKKIEQTEAIIDGRPVHVTASLGVAAMSSRTKRNDLFPRADAVLYQAKRKGPNEIKIAN